MAIFGGHFREAFIKFGGQDDVYQPIWFLYNQMEILGFCLTSQE